MSTPTSLALMFPGQGSQAPGMGAPWRDRPAWAVVDEIAEAAGSDVAALLLDADAETLRRTDRAQLAVFALCLVVLADLHDAGLPAGVHACAGHSLGELAALVAAGALTLPDGARLVAARGEAMRQAAAASPGTMGVLVGRGGRSVDDVVAEARGAGAPVWVANRNAPGQVVVSGSEAGVAAAAELAATAGLRLIRIPVGGAFHTPLVAAAAPALEAALATVTVADDHVPVVANVDARAHVGPVWRDLLLRQLTSEVRWEESLRTLTAVPGCALVEVGPGAVLAGTARRTCPDVPVLDPDPVR